MTRARFGTRSPASGPIPFERFMDLALYGEHGLLHASRRWVGGSAAATSSRRPRSARCSAPSLARYLDAEWERIGRPDPFTVVDAGAGPGTLARSVLAARPACLDALTYVAVEVSPAQRERHPDGIESRADLPAAPFDGVVIANELLDNLPFRLAVFDDGWREAFVDVDRRRSVRRGARAPSRSAAAVAPAPPDRRCPGAARRACARRSSTTRAGCSTPARWSRSTTARRARRPRRCVRGASGCAPTANERGGHYLADAGRPGHHDRRPVRPAPRAGLVAVTGAVPPAWGIAELVAEGVRVWTEQARPARPRGDADAQPGRRVRGPARPHRPRRLPRRRVALHPTAMSDTRRIRGSDARSHWTGSAGGRTRGA